MKSLNLNLIKQVNRMLKQQANQPKHVNSREYYTLEFKRKVIMHAVAHNAEHTSNVFKLPSKTVRQWLRSVGLESAVNSYFWKSKAAKAKLFKVA